MPALPEAAVPVLTPTTQILPPPPVENRPPDGPPPPPPPQQPPVVNPDRPMECIWVAAWADNADYPVIFGETQYDATDVLDYIYKQYQNDISTYENIPSCFSSRWKDCQDTHYRAKGKFYGWCGPEAGDSDSLADFLGAPRIARDYFGNPSRDEIFYFDKNCDWVENEGNAELCGFTGVSWSPISLMWDESASLYEHNTVVRFSLAENDNNEYSLWRASDKAPLLVYDPYKTGDVTSPRQLFGNFAFGGQTLNIADYQNDSVRAPWNNGFDALALLDKNKDGKLSGAELAPLALWFDADRDARVDDGELRPVVAEGIVSLFYRGAQTAPGSQDVVLQVGFERMIDGELYRGVAVDWYAETFASRYDAVHALRAMHKQPTARAQVPSDQLALVPSTAPAHWPDNPLQFAHHTAENHEADLSGYWVWTLDERNADYPPGFFTIEQKEGKLFGFSIVESRLMKNARGYRSAVQTVPFSGVTQINRKGAIVVSMKTKQDHERSESTARLLEDGSILKGKTRQFFSGKVDGVQKSAYVDYTWTARKIAFKNQ